MKALVIIAHGSKKSSSNEEFLQMVDNIKNKNTEYNFIEASFLELANPDIRTCVSNLLLENISNIDFYPFFLNSGKHVLIDIPNIINEIKLQYPKIQMNLLEHFGKSENVEKIILSDISL